MKKLSLLVMFFYMIVTVAQDAVVFDCVHIYERFDPTGFVNIRVYDLNTETLEISDTPVHYRGQTSPDGQYRAFLYPDYQDEQFDLSNSTFYIRDLVTGNLSNIHAAVNDNTLLYGHDIAWSPDSTQIALLSAEGQQQILLVADIANNMNTIILNLEMIEGNLVWSEDGQLLAINDFVYDARTLQPVQAQLESSEPSTPTPINPSNIEGRFLDTINDSWEVYFVEDGTPTIVLQNVETGEKRQLTGFGASDVNALYHQGEQGAIYYYELDDANSGLYFFNVEDEQGQTHFVADAARPVWSPDNSRVVYHRWQRNADDTTDTMLEVLELDTFAVSHSIMLNNNGEFYGAFTWANCERGY